MEKGTYCVVVGMQIETNRMVCPMSRAKEPAEKHPPCSINCILDERARRALIKFIFDSNLIKTNILLWFGHFHARFKDINFP